MCLETLPQPLWVFPTMQLAQEPTSWVLALPVIKAESIPRVGGTTRGLVKAQIPYNCSYKCLPHTPRPPSPLLPLSQRPWEGSRSLEPHDPARGPAQPDNRPFSTGGCGWMERRMGSLRSRKSQRGDPLPGPVTQTGRNGGSCPGGWGPRQATPPSHQGHGLQSGKNNRGRAAEAAVRTAQG